MPENKLFDKVTKHILQDVKTQKKPEDTIKDSPLQVEHPAANIALMIAQPGSVVEKLLAPSAYKGLFNAIQTGGDVTGAMFPTPKGFLPRRYSKGKMTDGDITRYWNQENNTINATCVKTDFETGKNDALNFFDSDAYKESSIHNKNLAHRLGKDQFIDYSPYAKDRASTNMELGDKPLRDASKIWIGDENNGFYITSGRMPNENGFVTINTKSAKKDKIMIDLHSDIDDTSFHENLHRGFYGEAPQDNLLDCSKYPFVQTTEFWNWKTRHLLKYPTDEYLSSSGEAAVNALQIGRRAGLEIGQPYPGKEKALEVYQNIIENDHQKGATLSRMNYDTKPKRVWEAITGKYYKEGGEFKNLATYNHLNGIMKSTAVELISPYKAYITPEDEKILRTAKLVY